MYLIDLSSASKHGKIYVGAMSVGSADEGDEFDSLLKPGSYGSKSTLFRGTHMGACVIEKIKYNEQVMNMLFSQFRVKVTDADRRHSIYLRCQCTAPLCNRPTNFVDWTSHLDMVDELTNKAKAVEEKIENGM